MKKGIVSPMNTVPEWIRKPTNLESSPNLSILNDYVRILVTGVFANIVGD